MNGRGSAAAVLRNNLYRVGSAREQERRNWRRYCGCYFRDTALRNNARAAGHLGYKAECRCAVTDGKRCLLNGADATNFDTYHLLSLAAAAQRCGSAAAERDEGTVGAGSEATKSTAVGCSQVLGGAVIAMLRTSVTASILIQTTKICHVHSFLYRCWRNASCARE